MLQISDADIAARLRADNPWWTRAVDPAQAPFALPRRAYFAPLRQFVGQPVKRAVILLGARRVGKTTMLRQLIGELAASRQMGPILFASVDTPTYSDLPLARLLEFFVQECPHDPARPRLVVFDEIQYLRDWERHLKDLVDRYPATKFIASGSAGAALKLKSEESGAGRFTDFELPPLTFAEFLQFRGVEGGLIRPIETKPNGVDYEAKDLSALNAEFVEYVNFGGYPEVVMSAEVRGQFAQFVGRDIVDKVLLRDLPSLYGIADIQELNRLFTSVAYNTGQELSLEALAQSSGVAKNTIARYLDYLEAAFLIFRVRRIDDHARRFQRQRTFKVYLTNPSMRAALFGPVAEDHAAIGALAETAAFCQWLHSPERRNLHYARWKQGEVDVVRINPANGKPSWAYDVKWSDRHVERVDELAGLLAFATNVGLKIVGASTKTVTSRRAINGIEVRLFPLSLHCYRLGKVNATGATINRLEVA